VATTTACTRSPHCSSIELFFDLVYVFAITPLSHHLLAEPTVIGAFQTVLLRAMVWLVWVYTTWVTNWLDPQRILLSSGREARAQRRVTAAAAGR